MQLKEVNSRLRNKMEEENKNKLENQQEEAKIGTQKPETKEEIIKDIEKTGVPSNVAKKEEKLDEKATKGEDKKEKEPEKKEEKDKKKEKPKKIEARVNAVNVPVSTKHSAAVCSFILGKQIPDAISDLEQVSKKRKAVPMKGEIPHRRGKIMAGRFPEKTAKEFVKLLRGLGANANYHGIENPIITTAIANIGERPFGRYGVRRKRTHVTLIAKSKIEKKGEK